MSFWSVDGEDIRETTTKDTDLKNEVAPIPDKTKVLALVDQAGKADKDGAEYAYATMTIVKPEAYAGRKVFAKFWVFDDNPHQKTPEDKAKKRKNDLARFTKLDIACGGKLTRKGATPSDEDIAMAFTNKQVIVHIMLMTPKDGSDPVQWYSDYWAKGTKELSEVAKPVTRKPAPVDDYDDDLDGDSVPF